MLKLILLTTLCTYFLIKQAHSQTTSDCDDGTTSCFYTPITCKSDNTRCRFIFKWKDNGDSNDFIIAGNMTDLTNRWLGIAFSKDASMGDDCVAVCKSSGIVEHYYNPYSSPIWLSKNKSIGLSKINVTQVNSWLVCSFTRVKSISNITNYFDLNNKFYILAAAGFLKPSTGEETDLNQHNLRAASNVLFTFNSTSSLVTKAPDPTALSSLTVSNCGVTHGCFLIPDGCKTESDCNYIFKYAKNGNSIKFELNAKIPNLQSAWTAIGFSKDTLMGDDGVILCKSSGSVEQRYNTGKSSPSLLDQNNPSVGISNASVNFINGWLMCSFLREIKNDNIKNYFDLNNDYFIMAAYGPHNPILNSINKHISRESSNSALNLNYLAISSGMADYRKYKTHGCLMALAWMLFASTGILFARYYKFLLPNKKPMDLQVWFVVHKPVMLFVPLLSLIAFLVILSQLNWKWVNATEKTEFAHSIFGIVAIGFAFIQPVIAFLRCDKDHKYRFVFNIVHRSLGLSALLFSIIALYLGSVIDVMFLENNGWGIILGWTLWLIVLVLLLEIIVMRYEPPPTSRSYVVNSDETQSGFAKKIKIVLLILHIIITLAFTIALIVVIGRAQPKYNM